MLSKSYTSVRLLIKTEPSELLPQRLSEQIASESAIQGIGLCAVISGFMQIIMNRLAVCSYLIRCTYGHTGSDWLFKELLAGKELKI